jgi:uncharacterized iron-regulated membrane protein
MKLRPLIFWPHLICGVVAGLVVLIMSVTGALLMYEKQMIAWADRRAPIGVPPDAVRLPIDQLLARVQASGGMFPAAVTIAADPKAPVLATLGQRIVVVHPYSGTVIGDSAPRLRRFFRGVTDWHRWLAASTERRPFARAMTGWSTAIFLFILMSGAYLWLPRVWSWRHLKTVALFNGRLSGKARDFNWHNVIGVWSLVPLFFVVVTALPISFPWANALLYRAVGEAPPPAGRPVASPSGAPARRVITETPGTEIVPARLSEAWTRAERQVTNWKTITVRLPASAQAPLTFTIDRGTAGQPQHRGTLTIDAATGDVVRWEPFGAQSVGRRVRSLSRFLHTGEVLGIAGQTVAGIASAGAAVLVWTGLALAWRRFARWSAARRSGERHEMAA